jgi:hypothetical protein
MDLYMSRLNQQNSLNYGNKETHIFTEFGTLSKESTQKEVLDAIKNINLNVGEIVVGDITVESSDTVTHTKLDTLNTTVSTKHLNNTTDSVTVSGTVAISNDIIIVDNINNTDAPYDLLINGPTLWADSTPAGTPFFADPNGREGWYYDNFSNIANVSNIYWYANPVSGNLQENDMTFAQLSGIYCIITPDYVENGALTNPIMAVYSQPTGTNDFIPTFAHSRWSYSLSNTNIAKLRKSETIMLYTGTTRPDVHLNIPAYPLVLAGTNGDALSSEIVAYMTVNTQATTSKIGYLLQYTGFLNSAIGFNREFQFKNSKERVIQNNQYSGSINIGNFPTTQAVSGSVNVSGSVTVNTISGFSLDTTSQATNTKLDTINTTISNKTLDKTTSSIDISGQTVNVNTISGFATETTQNAIKTNTDKIKSDGTITDAIQVAVKNTVPVSGSITVNTISGFATETTQNAIKTNTDKIKSDGTITDAIQVAVKNTVPVSGSVGVSSLPAIKAMIDDGETFTLQDLQGVISTSGYNSLSVYNYDLDTKFHNDSTFTNAIETVVKNQVGITGSVSVSNQITGFATSANQTTTNTKLDTINTTITNKNLNATNDSVTATVSNQITGFATSANQTTTNTKLDTINTTITNKNLSAVNDSVSATISNTSLDTHCYGSSNGTTWHHLKTDANGILNVHSMTQDGAGTDITSTTISTKQALDVNVAGGSISISSVNIKDSNGNNLQAVSNVLPQLKTTLYTDTGNAFGTTADPIKAQIVNTSAVPVSMSGLTSGVAISDGINSANIKRLDSSDTITSTYGVSSKSLVCGVVSGTASPVGMTVGGALKVNIENTTVPIGGNVYAGLISDCTKTQTSPIPSKIFLDTMCNIRGLNPLGGANNDMVTTCTPSAGGSNAGNTFTRCLDTTAFLTGANIANNDFKTITYKDNGTNRALDVNIASSSGTVNTNDASANTKLTSIDTELISLDNKTVQQYNTTNDGGLIGLNINQIRPKVKYYTMRGRSTVADNNMLFGGIGSSRYFFNDAFGIANVKPWYAYSGQVIRTITYEYVDASGNQGTGTRVIPVASWTQLTLQNGSTGNFLLNKWSQSINPIASSGDFFITHTTNNNGYSSAGGNYQDTFNSLFTVPNGFVACITNVMIFSNAADDYFILLKWSASGIRDIVYYWTNAKYINENYYNGFGGVGGVFTAGETIAFASLNNASYKDFTATVMLMPV